MDINKVIEDNMGLVYNQLHKFRLVQDPEAMSLGMEALWKAATTYREDANAKFSTYASVCIYNALGCYLRRISRKYQLDVVSYETPIYEGMTIKDTIRSKYSAEEAYMQELLNEHILQSIERVISSFPADHRQQLVRYWIDSDCKAKQRDLSEKFGVSQSYASRVLSMAKYRLRKELEEYTCEK